MTIPTPSMAVEDVLKLEDVEPAAAPCNADEVADLIRRLLCDYLQKHRADFTEAVGDDMSFDYIGLDSLARVGLLSDLDQALSLKLDPTAAYDFVTVRALAEYVWSTRSGMPMNVRKVLGV